MKDDRLQIKDNRQEQVIYASCIVLRLLSIVYCLFPVPLCLIFGETIVC